MPSITDYLVEEEEQEIIHDMSYTTYLLNSVFIHHQVYAGIQFSIGYATNVELIIETTVFTCDNLKVRVFKDPTLTEFQLSGQGLEIPSSEADSDEWTKPRMRKTTSNVPGAHEPFDESPSSGEEQSASVLEGIDTTGVEIECNNLVLTILENRATIQTQIRKPGCNENVKCGQLEVR